MQDFGLLVAGRRDRRRRGSSRASRRRSPASGPARWRATASTASSCWPGSTGAQVTVLRLYAKVMRQAGSTFSQAYMEDALAHHPAIAAKLVRAVRAPLRSRARSDRARRDRTARQARSRPISTQVDEPRRGPHHPRLPDARHEIAAHQLLPAPRRRRAEALSRGQAREPRHRAVPAAAAACARSSC